jgi:hypothetical protein
MWSTLRGWLRDDPFAEASPMQAITNARADFHRALTGLIDRDVESLSPRIEAARSLRELWHLRTELYGLIARHLGQVEAERRLAGVNRHFPKGRRGLQLQNFGSDHHG